MIKSMTGFGSAKGVSGKLEISIEIKSVNNRHLDCTVKMPRVFSSVEEAIKTTIAGYISRGKVDVSIYVDSSNADDIEVKANHSLAKGYIDALREIACENGLSGDITISDLTRYPDILQASRREIDAEAFLADINKILEEALTGFTQMRTREGEKLKHDISARLDEIDLLTTKAEEISITTVPAYRSKLEARMQEVLQASGIDEERILTEAAIFADRVAINEEIVRLRSHTGELRSLISKDEPVGRRIDFVIQELNREANTIGSKGNDAAMSKVVVALKSEIEKIREQAMNVE